jgi:5-methylcytosine-specific restriction protein A
MGWRVCSTPSCPEVHEGTGRCPTCRAEADQGHRTRFRPAVLAKNGGRCVDCGAPATVADHDPLDRDELVARGLDPDDPQHGQPRCKRDHDRRTAATKPAGFRG